MATGSATEHTRRNDCMIFAKVLIGYDLPYWALDDIPHGCCRCPRYDGPPLSGGPMAARAGMSLIPGALEFEAARWKKGH